MKALEIMKQYMKAKDMRIEEEEGVVRVTLCGRYSEDAWWDCEEILEEMAIENYSGCTYRDYMFEDGEFVVEFESADE